MVTLNDFKADAPDLGLNARDLLKLSVKNADQDRMKYELKTIFALMEALETKSSTISIDETKGMVQNDEFKPTMGAPDIIFTDKLSRVFSIWYKPVFYLPYEGDAKRLVVDFVIVEGKKNSLYNIDQELEKKLFSKEYITTSGMIDLSTRLLSKKVPIHMVFHCRQEFSPNDVNDVKAADFFLKPKRNLMVSEKYADDAVKMLLPFNVTLMDHLDMNTEKFKTLVRKMF